MSTTKHGLVALTLCAVALSGCMTREVKPLPKLQPVQVNNSPADLFGGSSIRFVRSRSRCRHARLPVLSGQLQLRRAGPREC